MHGALYVGLGSAVGGIARWVLGGWVQQRFGAEHPAAFPLGTLLVNVSGSFVIGVLAAAMHRRGQSPDDAMRLLLAVGFCGGYTTFSAFSLETLALIEARGWWPAAGNVMASVALGVAGAVGGMSLGRMLWR